MDNAMLKRNGMCLFAKASEAYDVGDFKKSFDLFLSLAESGDADAMCRVASMYGTGEGVQFDFEKSVEWDKKAVRAGSASSLFNLGISYRTRGDARQAKQWFEKALKAGDCEAALELAKLYLVSDLELERVKNYLNVVINCQSVTEGSREEAIALLKDIYSGPVVSGNLAE